MKHCLVRAGAGEALMDGELFSWIGSLSLAPSLRADRVGYLSWNNITCLAGKRALNNLTSSCGNCFRFLFLPHLFYLGVQCCSAIFFFCCFLTLEKLKIANKASYDKGARFLKGLLFKYLLCICCLGLLNMHWKSDFCSTFCVDLGHFIPSLCRAEQIGRSVRSFECTRNRLSFRKDLCCKPPIIFCQLRASKQNLSLCCCVLLYFCPQAALRLLQHSHRCRWKTDWVCVFQKKRKRKKSMKKENRKKLLVHTPLSLSCNSSQPGL